MFRSKKIKKDVRKRLDENILGILAVSELKDCTKKGHLLVTERHIVYTDETKFTAIHHYDIHSFGIDSEEGENKSFCTFYIKSKKNHIWYVTEFAFPCEKAKKFFSTISSLQYYHEPSTDLPVFNSQ
ncbi:hypothetical protein HPT25_06355 [Bacillus sp. BRMEA1]|uniref:hypothetical protein n=1 Tax=Neobacillus endophyticus TaxID=2738405 RepID=UPI00156415E8|nr:hypothetical protein [Neobacillus endophyticus]NRD77116.1 hypothetical protein [Neobacillus endophyticus]